MPRPMSRLRALMPAAAVLALCAGGCHNKQDAYTEASSEGVYLKAGGLKYQIQISRGMNPGLREDATLMRGLPKATKPTAGANEWFGVWMRVENDGSHGPKPVARTFEISASLGQVYKPIPLDPKVNALAYQPNQTV